MPNVNPPTTTVERYRALIEHHSKNAIVDFNHNPSGTVPEEIPGLAKEGPLAFKIFMVKDTGRDYPHMPGIGINNNGELFKCFETVGNTGLPLMVHPHDQDLMDEIEGRYWKTRRPQPAGLRQSLSRLRRHHLGHGDGDVVSHAKGARHASCIFST